MHDITVHLAYRMAASIKSHQCFLRLPHYNICWQMGVQSAHDYVGREMAFRFEIHDLSYRMHPGICTATGVGMGFLTGQLLNCSFQCFLHRAETLLRLPSEEVRTIVAEREFEVTHRRQSEPVSNENCRLTGRHTVAIKTMPKAK